MPFLAAAAPYIGLATTAVSAYSQNEAGKASAAEGKLAQIQADRNANAEEAMAQQQAASDRKKARYLRSRALAVAGASGAGVSDPTVSDILTGIDSEGEMNALTALYEGRVRADNTRAQGKAYAREGRASRGAATGRAVGTLATGLSDFASSNPSFFSKYGGERAQSYADATSDSSWMD